MKVEVLIGFKNDEILEKKKKKKLRFVIEGIFR